jgi:hypothetical protein
MGHARPCSEPTFYLDGTRVARVHAAPQQFQTELVIDLRQKDRGFVQLTMVDAVKIDDLFLKNHSSGLIGRITC